MSQFIGNKLELPVNGIHTEDGFLFHHVGTRELNSEMVERLHEFGTGYLHGTRFKLDEDDLIRENWRQYATKHDIDQVRAQEFAGFGDRFSAQNQAEVRKRRQFCKDTNFWPSMCDGLPHRSGYQVKRRMQRIFDKSVLEGRSVLRSTGTPKTHPTTLSHRVLIKFIEEYQRVGNLREAAQRINEPYMVCQNAYERFLNLPFQRSAWFGLWNTVINSVTSLDEKTFLTSLKRAIRKRNHEELARLKETIDFRQISQNITKRETLCVETWDEIVAMLMAKYARYYEKYEHKKLAWTETRRKTFKCTVSTSVEKFSQFLRILVKSIDQTVCYLPLNKKFVNMERLISKIIKYGVSGVDFEENESVGCEAERLIVKVQSIMLVCEELIFRRLALKFKLHERVKIISNAFDRQIGKAGFEMPVLGQGDDKITEEELKKSEVSLFRAGYVTLNRECIIEAVILFAKKLDPDWIPPTAFRKYVEDEEVLNLFPEGKNNRALLSKKLLGDYGSYVLDKTTAEPSPKRKKKNEED